MTIKLIVDSTCDLPNEIIEDYDIRVLPLSVAIDDHVYMDGIDIQGEEVFKALREQKLPKTSQVSPKIFKDVFEDCAIKGQECIYLAFSSVLSGTYQTAHLIGKEINENYPGFRLEIIDSKSGSTATGLIAYEVAKMIRKEKSIDDILERMHLLIDQVEHLFTIDDLKHIYRGGRLSKTGALIGGALHIKPILQVNNGHMEVIGKARGTKRAMNKILDIMESRLESHEKQIIGISHSDNLRGALKLKEMLQDRFGYEDFIINPIGSVLASHLGIGGIGLFFFRKVPK